MRKFSHSNRIVVASAAKFEATPLLDKLIYRGISFTYIEVGIGAIRSAQISSSFRKVVQGRTILFVGSCGSSSNFTEPYLISPNAVKWNPIDVRQSRSYLVKNAEPKYLLSPHSELNQDGNTTEVSCSSSISLDFEPSPNVFENLELYSVCANWVQICARFYCTLGVTNQLGPNSHESWLKYHRDAAIKTAIFYDTMDFSKLASHD
jgi:hypothetical protein